MSISDITINDKEVTIVLEDGITNAHAASFPKQNDSCGYFIPFDKIHKVYNRSEFLLVEDALRKRGIGIR